MHKNLERHIREEIVNIALHSFGLFLSLIGFGVIVALTGHSGSLVQMISGSAYAATLVLLYASSILFHTTLALELPWKKAFETLDHCAIYLLIAGTYTPFLTLSVSGRLGWGMLILIWSLAFAGVVYKIFFFYRSDLLSTLAYVLMGWLSVVIIKPLLAVISWWGVSGLGLGGILYTVGAVFYVWDHKFPFAHAIWHLFVLAGSLCHFLTIFYFVIWPLAR